ncbi:hypothetical protein ACFYXH_35435 [Streptomyces sp. NPDC002730]|uniref:hypothetical protein n=1 Tax=Streptomyces sp. NPDC002730 TaxID=3364662 RepID=UPI0036CF62F4
MELGDAVRGDVEVIAHRQFPPAGRREHVDQRDAFGEPGCCEPGCLDVRLGFSPLASGQVVKEFGPVDEPVVAVGKAGPEFRGDFLADVDEGRAMVSAKAPALLLGSNDIGGAGQIELLFGRMDVLTDPEFVADVPASGGGARRHRRASV